MTADPGTILQYQHDLVVRIARELPGGWTSFHIHWEHVWWEGNRLEIYVVTCRRGSQDVDADVSFDTLAALAALQEAMAALPPEPWTAADLTLELTGQFRFTFGYGMPPLAAKRIRHAPKPGDDL